MKKRRVRESRREGEKEERKGGKKKGKRGWREKEYEVEEEQCREELGQTSHTASLWIY